MASANDGIARSPTCTTGDTRRSRAVGIEREQRVTDAAGRRAPAPETAGSGPAAARRNRRREPARSSAGVSMPTPSARSGSSNSGLDASAMCTTLPAFCVDSDQRRIRLLAGPLGVADHELADVALRKQHVVANHLRAGRGEVVDHGGVHQARPRPAADQRLHPADALVVDGDQRHGPATAPTAAPSPRPAGRRFAVRCFGRTRGARTPRPAAAAAIGMALCIRFEF